VRAPPSLTVPMPRPRHQWSPTHSHRHHIVGGDRDHPVHLAVRTGVCRPLDPASRTSEGVPGATAATTTDPVGATTTASTRAALTTAAGGTARATMLDLNMPGNVVRGPSNYQAISSARIGRPSCSALSPYRSQPERLSVAGPLNDPQAGRGPLRALRQQLAFMTRSSPSTSLTKTRQLSTSVRVRQLLSIDGAS
jgi:hypothetical protein